MKNILIAGIGNRLRGDDGFGPRVIDILSTYSLPENVEIRDVGTAGITIATDFSDYNEILFLDAMEMEGAPGKIIMDLIKIENINENISELAKTSLHEVGLEGLLHFSKAIGALPPKVILIGCKPKNIDISLDLSKEVEEATVNAARMVIDYLEKKDK